MTKSTRILLNALRNIRPKDDSGTLMDYWEIVLDRTVYSLLTTDPMFDWKEFREVAFGLKPLPDTEE